MESNSNKRKLNFVSVGQITSTFGLKGEVKVKILTEFPERFLKQKKFLLTFKDLTKEIILERVRFQKNTLIAKIDSCDSIDSAKNLKGAYLQVKEEDLKKLPPDTFYDFQIIGLKVYSLENLYLGKIKDIIKTGSNDVYVVETSKEDILVPATKEFVKNINLPDNKMYVVTPEII